MRLSKKKHTLAILRLELGLHQQGMADIAECSRELIQAVELGRAPLSEKLAKKVFLATGVGLSWLTDDKVDAPIVDVAGQPYTRDAFERARAGGDQQTEESRRINRESLAYQMADLFAVYVAAENTSIQATYILGLRFRDFFNDIWQEFGLDAATMGDTTRLAMIRDALKLTGPVTKAKPVKPREPITPQAAEKPRRRGRTAGGRNG